MRDEMTRVWTCEMFWRAGYRPRAADGPCGCCTSCHEDANMGYAAMCQGTFRGREYEVCCRMAETLAAKRLTDKPTLFGYPIIEGDALLPSGEIALGDWSEDEV